MALTLCGPPPATHPMVWGMGGNVCRETNFRSECEALDNMAWCLCHTMILSDDKEGLHWFVCAFECLVECLIIWVWEPLSSGHLIRPFLVALKGLCLTTKHLALGLQKDSWSCGFRSLHITNPVVDHRGSFSDVPLTPVGPGFVDCVLSIVNACCAVRVVEPLGEDLEGMTELLCHLEPPNTQVEGAPSGFKESVHTTPIPLKGKDASSEQSVKGLEAKAQPSMATPTDEDTRPKVLIRGEQLPQRWIWPVGALPIAHQRAGQAVAELRVLAEHQS